MKRGLLRGLTILAFILSVSASPGLDWPVSPVSVIGEFGSPMRGYPMPGIFLGGAALEIRAAGKGELSFSRSARDARTKLPSVLGSTVVSEGAEGISQLYGFLPDSIDAASLSMAAGSLVTRSAQTNSSPVPGFFFSLFDRKTGRWVNPRMFLPPLADTKAPSIRRVSMEGRDKVYVLGDQKTLPQGIYSLLIESIESSGTSQDPIIGPPYYLRVLVNGEKLAELKTEIAATTSGYLSFYPEERNGAELLDGQGRLRLPPRSFARGKTSIEVLVRDFAGNERSAGWILSVE